MAPDALVVSTNEPFWQARVEGGMVLLNGAGVVERRLQIRSWDTDGAIRTLRATDAQGAVDVRVINAPCQDDMSGAAFPMTGALTIDGSGPHRGCARPATMAAPHP